MKVVLDYLVEIVKRRFQQEACYPGIMRRWMRQLDSGSQSELVEESSALGIILFWSMEQLIGAVVCLGDSSRLLLLPQLSAAVLPRKFQCLMVCACFFFLVLFFASAASYMGLVHQLQSSLSNVSRRTRLSWWDFFFSFDSRSGTAIFRSFSQGDGPWCARHNWVWEAQAVQGFGAHCLREFHLPGCDGGSWFLPH